MTIDCPSTFDYRLHFFMVSDGPHLCELMSGTLSIKERYSTKIT
jgi:hypothetical protein